jgi:biotin carboxyl carrier protein
MKMENVLAAEIAGTVKEVHVKPGDMVEPGKLLVLVVPKQ